MNESSERFQCCGISAAKLRQGMLLAVALLIALLAAIPTLALAPSADLRLRSQPDGASVFLNGRLVGVTPVVLSSLRTGSYGLRFEKEGYETCARSVTLKRSGAEVNEMLSPLATVHLTVDVRPAGSEVLLDGELQGHTPLELNAVPVGLHELLVRKTNFKPFARQVDVSAGQPLAFRGFELDDKVLEMLNGNIAKEDSRVAHYMDLGHYLFVNDHLTDAAVAYSRALEVSAAPLTFAKESPPEEQRLLSRLRSEDRSRLGSQISLKESWPGKDVAAFTKGVEGRRSELNEKNIRDWGWISEQASFYTGRSRLDDAQKLLLQFIDVNKSEKNFNPDGPYMAMLNVRLKLRKIELLRETCETIFNQFKLRTDLLRQAGDALLTGAASLEPKDKPEALKLSERFFREGAEQAGRTQAIDVQALCQYELGLSLALQNNLDGAIAVFRQSIELTKDAATRELRAQKLAECYRSRNDYTSARTVLTELAQSPRPAVATKAKQDLNELASVEAAGKSK